MIGRRIVLTERMHLVLLGVVNDACIDAPEDIDLRKLRNICRAAKHVDELDEPALAPLPEEPCP